MLEAIGIAGETVRVGAEAHVEILAPLREDVALEGWTPKRFGGAGCALSIQMRDLQRYLDRAAEVAVQTVTEVHPVAMGLFVDASPPQRSLVARRLARDVLSSHGMPTRGLLLDISDLLELTPRGAQISKHVTSNNSHTSVQQDGFGWKDQQLWTRRHNSRQNDRGCSAWLPGF